MVQSVVRIAPLTSATAIGLVLFPGFRFGVLGGSRVGETFTEFYVLGPGG